MARQRRRRNPQDPVDLIFTGAMAFIGLSIVTRMMPAPSPSPAPAKTPASSPSPSPAPKAPGSPAGPASIDLTQHAFEFYCSGNATYGDLNTMYAVNPNIVSQYVDWQNARLRNGETPYDWSAFRQAATGAYHAPDPGPYPPSTFCKWSG